MALARLAPVVSAVVELRALLARQTRAVVVARVRVNCLVRVSLAVLA
jgi:hypothetical protein